MADQLQLNQTIITDANDNPVPNAKLWFYETGTVIPVVIYTDSAATVVASQPVRSDGAGRVVQLYFNSSVAVKMVVTTSTDASLYTLDPLPRVALGGTGAAAITFSPIVENAATNVQAAIANNSNRIAALTATDIDYTNGVYPSVNDVGDMLNTIVAGEGISIGLTTDLDTLTQPGLYVQNDPAAATLALNYPFAAAGQPAGAYITLRVIRLAHGGVTQFCQTAFNTYYRTYDLDITGTYWTDWDQMLAIGAFDAPFADTGTFSVLNATTRFTLAGTVVTVAKAHNVTSITRTGVGAYTVNFTNAFPDVNYTVGGSYKLSAGTAVGIDVVTRAVGSVAIVTRNTSGTAVEATDVSIMISA